MKGVIYKYTFPNGKVYIGQTRRNPELRHREHLDPVTGPCNSGFWEEYQKFLEYKYEIIETVEESDSDIIDVTEGFEERKALEQKGSCRNGFRNYTTAYVR